MSSSRGRRQLIATAGLLAAAAFCTGMAYGADNPDDSSLAQQIFDARPHLLGGFVGEGHRQHLIRPRVSVGDQVGDSRRDHARFAGTGSRKDEERAGRVKDSRCLRRIE